MTEKKRLDAMLLEKGLETSRERAKAIIMQGIVYVNDQKVDKAGTLCREEDLIEVRGSTLKYVSRGGLKLEKALAHFQYDPSGQTCIDIGASTGGFTDCLLMNGAAHVYAVDVGYGQLAWKLRSDERVTCLDRTNFRYVTREQIGQPIDLAVCDVSFISLKLILPVVHSLLKPDGTMLTLIKPQFEAGRGKVGKKGVVRDAQTHIEVIMQVLEYAKQNGFTAIGLTYSPIKGPEGNIEFLLHLSMSGEDAPIEVETLVKEAHTNAGWL